MTREDAISIMNVIVHMLEEKYDTDRVEEAVDMAIKSLEQEPCEDCISRAEAINAISHAELSFQVESDLNFENYKREVQEIADGILKGQVKAINDLPSIQPKPKTGHWIEKDGFDGDTYYNCSECGESWTTIEGTPWNNGMKYCPNCGAKMESEG